MTTAESFVNTSDDFGKGFPLKSEIIHEGGTIVDSSTWYNAWPPYTVWEFPDKSQLIFSGIPTKLFTR
jgi:hypothetical protein